MRKSGVRPPRPSDDDRSEALWERFPRTVAARPVVTTATLRTDSRATQARTGRRGRNATKITPAIIFYSHERTNEPVAAHVDRALLGDDLIKGKPTAAASLADLIFYA